MRRVGWALLVLSLILIPTVVFLKQHWVQGRLKESLAQLRSGHPEKALDLAEDVLSHNRENLQAVRIAALAHQELGDFEKSAVFFCGCRTDEMPLVMYFAKPPKNRSAPVIC